LIWGIVLRNKKLKDILDFTRQSVEEMMVDDEFKEWSAEDIFQLASEVALNEHSAKGSTPPVGEVDKTRVAFCISDTADETDVIVIQGEGFIDD
jgi:hypothetical protein